MTDAIVTPAVLAVEIQNAISVVSAPREVVKRWKAIDRCTERLCLTRYELEPSALIDSLKREKTNPYIASALVTICDWYLPKRKSKELIHTPLLNVYDTDQLASYAASYLSKVPEAMLEDGEWAWHAIHTGEVTKEERWSLALKLIEKMPNRGKSNTGWFLIADVLVGGMLQNEERDVERWERLAESNERVAYVIELQKYRL